MCERRYRVDIDFGVDSIFHKHAMLILVCVCVQCVSCCMCVAHRLSSRLPCSYRIVTMRVVRHHMHAPVHCHGSDIQTCPFANQLLLATSEGYGDVLWESPARGCHGDSCEDHVPSHRQQLEGGGRRVVDSTAHKQLRPCNVRWKPQLILHTGTWWKGAPGSMRT